MDASASARRITARVPTAAPPPRRMVGRGGLPTADHAVPGQADHQEDRAKHEELHGDRAVAPGELREERGEEEDDLRVREVGEDGTAEDQVIRWRPLHGDARLRAAARMLTASQAR